MDASFNVVHRDSTLVLGHSGRLLLAVWWNAPTSEQMDVVARAARSLERGGPTAYAQFVITGTPRFTAEVRRKAEQLTREHFALGIAHVIAVGGLVGSATRAFLSALLLVAQVDKPIRVFREGEDGASWIAEKLGGEDSGWPDARVLDVLGEALQARP